jgi:hypothetical protein
MFSRAPESIRPETHQVGGDDWLAPIFNNFAHLGWAAHLPTMYGFRESMLLGAARCHRGDFRQRMGLLRNASGLSIPLRGV